MLPVDVVEIVRLLESHGIDVWIVGGWGVDALIGEQTREHLDLDVIVRSEDIKRLRELLGEHGFKHLHDWPEAFESFVLVDDRERKVDVHPVAFNEAGESVQKFTTGDRTYDATTFTGIGVIGGERVRCGTAEAQVLAHSGYELADVDIRDLRVLRDRLGVELPPHQQERL
jgi:lincosamide nucleotidyltransferase A/C/D/E